MTVHLLRQLAWVTLAILLTACSQDGFLSGIEYVNQPTAKDAYSVSRYSLPDHIVVRPVAGLPREASDELAELTAEHLARREFIATVDAPPQKTSRLTGWATPANVQTGKPSHIEYSLRNPDGELRLSVELPIEDQIFNLEELTGMERRTLLKRTAAATADRFYAIITQRNIETKEQERSARKQQGLPSQEKQMLFNPTGTRLQKQISPIYVLPALGAPGDGITALPKAMTDTLRTYGVTMSERPKSGLLQLQCIVALTPLGSAQEMIRISWELKSANGDIVATVDQSNAIESGTLDGQWGDTAYLVASAAAEGLVKALNDLDLPPPSATSDAAPE